MSLDEITKLIAAAVDDWASKQGFKLQAKQFSIDLIATPSTRNLETQIDLDRRTRTLAFLNITTKEKAVTVATASGIWSIDEV